MTPNLRVRRPSLLAPTACAAGGAALCLAGLFGVPAASAAGVNVLTNPSFSQPGTNGATPTGWAPVNLGVETAPFNASNAEFNASGQFPPPTPLPAGATFASEAFYQAGSSLGVEGFGGSQSVSGVTSATGGTVGYSVAETNSPDSSLVTWAGSVYEIDFTSGTTAYKLRYFNPFSPKPGQTYSGAPTNSSTIGYVTGATLPFKQFYSAPARDLAADITATFGLSTWTVTGVVYGDLENTTNAGGPPFPNETSYWTNLSLVSAPNTPPPSTPEVPMALALPLAGLAVLGGGVLFNRRRSTTA